MKGECCVDGGVGLTAEVFTRLIPKSAQTGEQNPAQTTPQST